MTPKQTTILLAVVLTLLIAHYLAFQWALSYQAHRDNKEVVKAIRQMKGRN